MKTIILFSLALIILTANSAPASVLDMNGKYLRTGVEYVVMPQGAQHGGLYVMDIGKNSCSPGVVLTYNDEDSAPLTIAPINPKKGVIRLSTDLNIKFFGDTYGWCNESNVWRLKHDKGLKQYAVMTGGVEGNPGPETLDNWFKIEKYNDGYKLVYCPSVCSYCKVMCSELGIVEDKDGWRRLAVSNDPFTFVFAPLSFFK